MRDSHVIWDDPDDPDGNTAHVAEHGLTPEEVESVMLNEQLAIGRSRASGRPCRMGWTSTGRYIFVCWDLVESDPPIIYPVTAYEVEIK